MADAGTLDLLNETGVLDSLTKEKKNILLKELNNFGSKKTQRLSKVNQGFNIVLTVTGLTFTALTTVLGVVDNPKMGDLIKFGVAFTGATAVAAQAASREFRIKGKAGKYIAAEAERTILVSRTNRATTSTEIKDLENELDKLMRHVGEIEKTNE